MPKISYDIWKGYEVNICFELNDEQAWDSDMHVVMVLEDGVAVDCIQGYSTLEEATQCRDKCQYVDDDREAREEIAREAGMLHGCAAYNEAMGYD